MDSKSYDEMERRESSGNARKKITRACSNCQQSHQRCEKPRPCQRCIERGISHKCFEGIRKKPTFIPYSVETPNLISSSCQLDHGIHDRRDTRNAATTVGECNSIAFQSKSAAAEIRDRDLKAPDGSLLHGLEYIHVSKESTKTQRIAHMAGDLPNLCTTEHLTWDIGTQPCRCLNFSEHRSPEVSDHGKQCWEETFPGGLMLHELEYLDNSETLFVHAHDMHIFSEPKSYCGFAISSGWASTFFYPE